MRQLLLGITLLLFSSVAFGDWAEDYNAAVRAAKALHKNVPLLVIGHSLGGQLPGLLPDNHLIDGIFQSDKYDWCKRDFVPLKVTDKDAQPVLWQYAQAHRARDPEFSADLEAALLSAGFYLEPGEPVLIVRETHIRASTFLGAIPSFLEILKGLGDVGIEITVACYDRVAALAAHEKRVQAYKREVPPR